MSKEFSRSFVFNAAGHDFKIDNYFTDSRYGFSHTSVVRMDNLNIGEAVRHYSNRSWELYIYQNSAIGAIREAIERYTETAKRIFKLNHHAARMTKSLKENFEAEIQGNKYIAGLREAIKVLEAGQPQTVYSWEV